MSFHPPQQMFRPVEANIDLSRLQFSDYPNQGLQVADYSQVEYLEQSDSEEEQGDTMDYAHGDNDHADAAGGVSEATPQSPISPTTPTEDGLATPTSKKAAKNKAKKAKQKAKAKDKKVALASGDDSAPSSQPQTPLSPLTPASPYFPTVAAADNGEDADAASLKSKSKKKKKKSKSMNGSVTELVSPPPEPETSEPQVEVAMAEKSQQLSETAQSLDVGDSHQPNEAVENLEVGELQQPSETVENLEVGDSHQPNEAVEDLEVGDSHQPNETVENLEFEELQQPSETVENLEVGDSHQPNEAVENLEVGDSHQPNEAVENLEVGELQQPSETVESLDIGDSQQQPSEAVESLDVGDLQQQPSEAVESLDVGESQQPNETAQNLDIGESQQQPSESLEIEECQQPPSESLDAGDSQQPPSESLEIEECQQPPSESLDAGDSQQPPSESLEIEECQQQPSESLEIEESQQQPSETVENIEVGGSELPGDAKDSIVEEVFQQQPSETVENLEIGGSELPGDAKDSVVEDLQQPSEPDAKDSIVEESQQQLSETIENLEIGGSELPGDAKDSVVEDLQQPSEPDAKDSIVEEVFQQQPSETVENLEIGGSELPGDAKDPVVEASQLPGESIKDPEHQAPVSELAMDTSDTIPTADVEEPQSLGQTTSTGVSAETVQEEFSAQVSESLADAAPIPAEAKDISDIIPTTEPQSFGESPSTDIPAETTQEDPVQAKVDTPVELVTESPADAAPIPAEAKDISDIIPTTEPQSLGELPSTDIPAEITQEDPVQAKVDTPVELVTESPADAAPIPLEAEDKSDMLPTADVEEAQSSGEAEKSTITPPQAMEPQLEPIAAPSNDEVAPSDTAVESEAQQAEASTAPDAIADTPVLEAAPSGDAVPRELVKENSAEPVEDRVEPAKGKTTPATPIGDDVGETHVATKDPVYANLPSSETQSRSLEEDVEKTWIDGEVAPPSSSNEVEDVSVVQQQSSDAADESDGFVLVEKSDAPSSSQPEKDPSQQPATKPEVAVKETPEATQAEGDVYPDTPSQHQPDSSSAGPEADNGPSAAPENGGKLAAGVIAAGSLLAAPAVLEATREIASDREVEDLSKSIPSEPSAHDLAPSSPSPSPSPSLSPDVAKPVEPAGKLASAGSQYGTFQPDQPEAQQASAGEREDGAESSAKSLKDVVVKDKVTRPSASTSGKLTILASVAIDTLNLESFSEPDASGGSDGPVAAQLEGEHNLGSGEGDGEDEQGNDHDVDDAVVRDTADVKDIATHYEDLGPDTGVSSSQVTPGSEIVPEESRIPSGTPPSQETEQISEDSQPTETATPRSSAPETAIEDQQGSREDLPTESSLPPGEIQNFPEEVDSSDQAITDGIDNSDQAITDGIDSSDQAIADGIDNSDQAITDGIDSSDQAITDGIDSSDQPPTTAQDEDDEALGQDDTVDLLESDLVPEIVNSSDQPPTAAQEDEHVQTLAVDDTVDSPMSKTAVQEQEAPENISQTQDDDLLPPPPDPAVEPEAQQAGEIGPPVQESSENISQTQDDDILPPQPELVAVESEAQQESGSSPLAPEDVGIPTPVPPENTGPDASLASNLCPDAVLVEPNGPRGLDEAEHAPAPGEGVVTSGDDQSHSNPVETLSEQSQGPPKRKIVNDDNWMKGAKGSQSDGVLEQDTPQQPAEKPQEEPVLVGNDTVSQHEAQQDGDGIDPADPAQVDTSQDNTDSPPVADETERTSLPSEADLGETPAPESTADDQEDDSGVNLDPGDDSSVITQHKDLEATTPGALETTEINSDAEDTRENATPIIPQQASADSSEPAELEGDLDKEVDAISTHSGEQDGTAEGDQQPSQPAILDDRQTSDITPSDELVAINQHEDQISPVEQEVQSSETHEFGDIQSSAVPLASSPDQKEDDLEAATLAAGAAAAVIALAGVVAHESTDQDQDQGHLSAETSREALDPDRPRTADQLTGPDEAPGTEESESHGLVSSHEPLSESFTVVDEPTVAEPDQDPATISQDFKPRPSRRDSSTQTDELWRPKTPMSRGRSPAIVLPDADDPEAKHRSRARHSRTLSRRSVQQTEEVVAAAVIIRAAADTLGNTSTRMADVVKDLKQPGDPNAFLSLGDEWRVSGDANRTSRVSSANRITGVDKISKEGEKVPQQSRTRDRRTSHGSRSSRPSTRDSTAKPHRHSSHRHRHESDRDAEQESAKTPPRTRDTADSGHGSHRSRRERTPQEQAEHDKRKEERRLAREKEKEREVSKTEPTVAEEKGKDVETSPNTHRSHRSSRRYSSTRVPTGTSTSRTEGSAPPQASKKFVDGAFGGPLAAETSGTSTKDKENAPLRRTTTGTSSRGIRRSLSLRDKLRKVRGEETVTAVKDKDDKERPRVDKGSNGHASKDEAKQKSRDDKHRKSRIEKREQEEAAASSSQKEKKSSGLKGMFRKLFS